MTTAIQAGRRLVMTSLLLAASAGCAGTVGAGGAVQASCAYVVTYEKRSYLHAGDTGFTVGEKLGTATVPECDDTPNAPGDTIPEGRVTAYEVEGMDPAVAIAVGDMPAGAELMRVNR